MRRRADVERRARLAVGEVGLGDDGAQRRDGVGVEPLPCLGSSQQRHGTVGCGRGQVADLARDQRRARRQRGRIISRERYSRSIVAVHRGAGRGDGRPGRRLGAARLALQRQGIDRLGVRLVGVTIEPVHEFGIVGMIVRAEIALGQHMAEEQRVLEPGDLAIGLAPGVALLQDKDALITGRRIRRHHAGQVGQHAGQIGLPLHLGARRQRGNT